MNLRKLHQMGAIALLGAALTFASAAAAQEIDLTESFSFDSGTTFSFPDGGEIEVDEDSPDLIRLDLDAGTAFVTDFAVFEDAGLDTDSTLTDAAQWYIETVAEAEFDPDNAEGIEIEGRDALSYPYEFDDSDWLLVLVRFESGGFGAIDSTDIDEDVVLAIAGTLDVAAETAPASGEACTLSTSETGTVQLRVGPGTNRTVFAFLPAGPTFSPLGQAEASDGSQWFQLDREEVAPQSAAAEAWVAAVDVDTSGDCTHIGEASAPPIVPIIPAAPPASSDSGGSADTPADSGSTQGSIAPAPGTWTISYGRNAKASCLDIQTIDVPLDIPSETVSLSVSGNTVNLDGSRLTMVQPNVYSGLLNLPDGESIQIVLRTVSSTQFSGEGIFNFRVDDHQCSGTMYMTVTKN